MQDPNWTPAPQYWVRRLGRDQIGSNATWFLGFKDITSSTNDADYDCGRNSHSAAVGNNVAVAIALIGGHSK